MSMLDSLKKFQTKVLQNVLRQQLEIQV
jgi:hypothetical protein